MHTQGGTAPTAPATATYPGGKNSPGVWQRIISEMPPHDHYVELFAGSGAIIRRKRPASGLNYAVDVDPAVVAALRAITPRAFRAICAAAPGWLPPPAPPRPLAALRATNARVILSPPRCDLYDRELAHWRIIDLIAPTRGGPRPDALWCTF